MTIPSTAYLSMAFLHMRHIGFPIRDPLWTFPTSPTSFSQLGLWFWVVLPSCVLPWQGGMGSTIGYCLFLWWYTNLVAGCCLRFLSKVRELLGILGDSMNTLSWNNKKQASAVKYKFKQQQHVTPHPPPTHIWKGQKAFMGKKYIFLNIRFPP